MTQDSLHQTIHELATPLAASLGLDVWGVEYAHGKRSLLRIYVENISTPDLDDDDAAYVCDQGVSVEQCAQLSRSLGLALDVEDIIPGAYVLEVSSPGMSRPFFSLQQMAAYLGHVVEVTLFRPRVDAFPGRKTFRGKLLHVEDDTIELELLSGESPEHEGALQLHWNDVKKARLSPDISVPAMPKEKKGGRKKKKSKKS